VLLDLDGTLIDGFKPIVSALNQTRVEFGMQPISTRDIQRHTGRGSGSVEAMFGTDWVQARPRFLELHDKIYLHQTIAMPGAESLLGWLVKNGLAAGLVTNKGQERAEAQIRHLGWSKKLAIIVGYVEGKPTKPDSEPVRLACKQMQIDTKESLFIGDGLADMQAASGAGSLPIGIIDSFNERELRQAGAQVCVPNIMEAHTWLKNRIA